MDYGSILRRGWEISWKNKGLWLLGILSGCTSGAGNPSQNFTWQTSGQEVSNTAQQFPNVPEGFWVALIIGVFVAILVLVVVAIVLGILGQAGLIAGVAHADETGSVKLAEAWRLGRPHFWRLLGLGLLLFAVVMIVALVIAGGVVLTLGLGAICLIPLICLALPIGIIVSAYLNLVQNGIVLGKQGVFEALGKGWEVFRAHFWPVVLMGVIMMVISFVAGLLISLPMIVAWLPLVAVAVSQSERGFVAFLPMIGCFLLYLPVLIVLGGILKTYVSSVWTVTYRRLTGAALAAVEVPAPG
jgi:hypothetical protein